MKRFTNWIIVLLCALPVAICAPPGHAKTLEVGDGKPFDRIEKANAAAKPGDVILVYPLKDGRPYEKTAVFVQQKNITFRAVSRTGKSWVPVSGKGYDFSGSGSTPRAIFQFNRGADGCTLEGFELSGATTRATTARACGSTRPTARRSAIARSTTTTWA